MNFYRFQPKAKIGNQIPVRASVVPRNYEKNWSYGELDPNETYYYFAFTYYTADNYSQNGTCHCQPQPGLGN
jgi:hypothetical protein